MAKKGHSAASRRQAASRAAMNNVQRSTTVSREQSVERTQPTPVDTPATKRVTPRTDSGRVSKVLATSASKAPEASMQYPYVLGDLKQLGIIAAAMFGVLIILSLIIR
jgi:hypothetical protein